MSADIFVNINTFCTRVVNFMSYALINVKKPEIKGKCLYDYSSITNFSLYCIQSCTVFNNNARYLVL